MAATKTFSLRIVLTVTTKRLLTKPRGKSNGIGDLYDILGWMTNDSPFTHQLPRFGDECLPWLIRWFPELEAASTDTQMELLDRFLSEPGGKSESGIRKWLHQLKTANPNIRDEYEVPRIPRDDHDHRNPIQELIDMRDGADGIVVVNLGDA